MRAWNIEVWLLDDQGNEVMPNVFEKAVYNLHPSFEKNKHGEFAGQCAQQHAF
jgi:transcription initiation factor IIF auxiliary subunit